MDRLAQLSVSLAARAPSVGCTHALLLLHAVIFGASFSNPPQRKACIPWGAVRTRCRGAADRPSTRLWKCAHSGYGPLCHGHAPRAAAVSFNMCGVAPLPLTMA
eukprot:1160593-Pelagomonas_calceolata.AAC.3